MSSIELTAPAKVNLVLRVLNKRKDSYHNLLTIFERVSLADRIKITRIPKGIEVFCKPAVTSRAQDNLAYKAADLLLRSAKAGCGVRIEIKKNIPVAAGLGGGSSDAASVLLGIDKLLGLRTGKNKLMKIGAKIGADVPFFIYNTPLAMGTGIGDKLKKLDLKAKLHHILIYPGFKLATKDVYGSLDLGLTTGNSGDKITLPKSFDGFEGMLHNDLEAAAVSKRPIIGRIIECLASSLGRRAMVSGSGPSVFCLCRTRKEAIKARGELYKRVPERFRRLWQVFIVETEL